MKTLVNWLVIVLCCAVGYTQVFGQVNSDYISQIKQVQRELDTTPVPSDLEKLAQEVVARQQQRHSHEEMISFSSKELQQFHKWVNAHPAFETVRDTTSVPEDKTTQLIKSAKVSQEMATIQLRELMQQYPEEASRLKVIEQLHKDLAVLLRNEENRDKGFFYQQALFWFENLASAVNSINNEKAKQNCLNIIDHFYYFAPEMKLSSLDAITDYVHEELRSLTGGFLTPQWGDFYKNLDGYGN